MDDFYRVAAERRRGESTSYGGAFDWERLLQQVLQPLLADVPGSYQRYDWGRDTLADWCHVPVGGIVVVEGVSSTRLELAKYYDFRIWIQTPWEVRLARGIERDGEEARDRWITEWMPEEDRYVELDQPHQRADVVVNGASRLVRDPWVEFACLAGS
jgi:uridine kinase